MCFGHCRRSRQYEKESRDNTLGIDKTLSEAKAERASHKKMWMKNAKAEEKKAKLEKKRNKVRIDELSTDFVSDVGVLGLFEAVADIVRGVPVEVEVGVGLDAEVEVEVDAEEGAEEGAEGAEGVSEGMIERGDW